MELRVRRLIKENEKLKNPLAERKLENGLLSESVKKEW
jgi:hypothetical protein